MVNNVILKLYTITFFFLLLYSVWKRMFLLLTVPCVHGRPSNYKAKMINIWRSFIGSDFLWCSLSDQQFYLPPTGKDLWCYGQQTSSHIQLQRGLETRRLLLWILWPFNIPSYADCSRGWCRLSLITFYIQAGCHVIILQSLSHSSRETFQWYEIL